MVEHSRGNRLLRVLSITVLMAVGAVIGPYLSKLGVGIPCVFHLWTGLECPGCGITRMLLALFRGDVLQAWSFNPFVMAASPFLLILLLRLSVRYIATGERSLNKAENIGVWICVIGLVVFGVVRNTPIYPYGQPV